jgi:snail 2
LIFLFNFTETSIFFQKNQILNFFSFKFITEFDSDMEPENLSTKPEDLSRTGKYPSKVLTPPTTDDSQSSTSSPPRSETVSPLSIPAPTATYPSHPLSYYNSPKSPVDVPLNLHSPPSPSESLSYSSPTTWHKPITPVSHYPNYIPFPGYPIPYHSDAYSALYHHHSQVSPNRHSEQLSPYHRENSVSPTNHHFVPKREIIVPAEAKLYEPYPTAMPIEMRRNNNNNIIKSEHYSNSHQHRYVPYHMSHHHQLMMPVDKSSLSPTSSHTSFNSYSSSISHRSLSPASTMTNSSTSSKPHDLTSNHSISVLMEKSTSSSNIQKPSKKSETTEKHNGAPRYQCPDCGKSYSTYSGLSKHQQFHCPAAEGNQAKKSYVCKYCEKVYASMGALKMHIRTHTLPCKCHLCGKAFSRPWLLQGHIRTHTGEKPFSCQHCHRAFADRSNLRAHLQTHSDVKKYSCTSCSKTFSRMSLLTKHCEGGCPGLQMTSSPSVVQHPMGYGNSHMLPGKDISVY